MKLHNLMFWVGIVQIVEIGGTRGLASAGGVFLPGAGAVSTSRAGAAVASADDGEALVLNPAGLAKTTGTTITISAALLQYAMELQRRGSYDAVPGQDYAYAGQPFPNTRNDAHPPLGIGKFQPLPVLAVVSDLGGLWHGRLRAAVGIYAPNAYPFRDMCTELPGGCHRYVFNDDAAAPPPARYDIIKQDAAVFLPSIAFAARVLPALDVGLRLSAAQASIKSTTALWATLGNNYQEDVSQDGTFSIDAKDSFVPTFGLGLAYRPTSNIELGFNYSHQLSIHAKGTSISEIGPNAGGGLPVAIGPNADENARCAPGGTMDVQKACVDFALPSTAQLGGRYKFLDGAGALKADVELDLSWENWGKSCSEDDFNSGSCVTPGDYRVVPDSSVYIAGNRTFDLRDAIVHHGLRDSYGVRVGGSYHVPLGSARERGAANEVIVRGGIGYDTAAAKPGWLRADLDGAARTTLTLGAAYRMRNVEISAGGGAILEGSPTNPNIGGGAEPCNTTDEMPGCGPSSATSRQGPDPIDPLRRADNQAESPIGQGDYKSHYVLFMLGATAWF